MGRNRDSFSGGQWNVLELEIARFFEETTRLGWPTVADEEARAVERIPLSVQCAECTWPSDDRAVPSNYEMIIGDLFPKSIGDAGHIPYGNSCSQTSLNLDPQAGPIGSPINPQWGPGWRHSCHKLHTWALPIREEVYQHQTKLRESQGHCRSCVLGQGFVSELVLLWRRKSSSSQEQWGTDSQCSIWKLYGYLGGGHSQFAPLVFCYFPGIGMGQSSFKRAPHPSWTSIHLKGSYLASLSKAQKVFVFSGFFVGLGLPGFLLRINMNQPTVGMCQNPNF